MPPLSAAAAATAAACTNARAANAAAAMPRRVLASAPLHGDEPVTLCYSKLETDHRSLKREQASMSSVKPAVPREGGESLAKGNMASWRDSAFGNSTLKGGRPNTNATTDLQAWQCFVWLWYRSSSASRPCRGPAP